MKEKMDKKKKQQLFVYWKKGFKNYKYVKKKKI